MTDEVLHYLYYHVDPDTREVLYVGTGSKERAWLSRQHNRNNPAHFSWLAELEKQGFTPDAWVEIYFSSFDREEVLALERQRISEIKPMFNYTEKWTWCLSLTDAQVEKAKELRSTGYTYKAIAKEIDSSTMTVYRLLTGQTKGYEK